MSDNSGELCYSDELGTQLSWVVHFRIVILRLDFWMVRWQK